MALKPARLQWSDDGTLKSLDYGDIYFQPGRGEAESAHVFLAGNDLPARLKAGENLRIAELGFGSGLNFLLTLDLFRKNGAGLTYVSFEKHPIPREDLARIFAAWNFEGRDALLAQYPPLIEGFHTLHFGDVRLILVFGDIAETLPKVGGTFDAWYLDGFSPAKNPEMWAEKLFPQIAERTAPGGTLATFSAAGHVRRGLTAVGFEVEKVDGFGTKRDMTIARFPGTRVAEEKKHVTVLGAGIAGCSVAHALAQRGHAVTVMDRGAACAAEASGNPIGIVYPKMTLDSSPLGVFRRAGFCYTRSLVTALGLPSWQACGVEDIHPDHAARHAKLGAQEYPADFLSYDGRALHLPMSGFLSPPQFCAALLDHPNIKTRFNTEVTELPEGLVVIALANASTLFANLPLRPVRGQVSYAAATPASSKLDHVICHDGYIAPAVDGVHCFGATFHKEPVSTPDVRTADHAENLEKLNKYAPHLNITEATGGRTSWRATTPDRLPFVGEISNNVYIATGFGAHGMSTAPLAGALIAALISGDPLPLPSDVVKRLSPGRIKSS